MQAVRSEAGPTAATLLPASTVAVLRAVFGLRADAEVSQMMIGAPHADARRAARPALRALAAACGTTWREVMRDAPSSLDELLRRFAARAWHSTVLLILDVADGSIRVARCGSPACNRTSLLTLLRNGAAHRLVYPVAPLSSLPSPLVSRGLLFEVTSRDRRRLAAAAAKK